MSYSKNVSNSMALSAITVASLVAATATFAAADTVNTEVVSYDQTAMILRVKNHDSRRTLNLKTWYSSSKKLPQSAPTCTTPAPLTCPTEYAKCVRNADGEGVARWECQRPAKKYN